MRAFAEVETLDIAKRTVLFRVAQEALTNVARHTHAGRVEMVGGTFGVVSAPGKGTTIQVAVPFAKARAAALKKLEK